MNPHTRLLLTRGRFHATLHATGNPNRINCSLYMRPSSTSPNLKQLPELSMPLTLEGFDVWLANQWEPEKGGNAEEFRAAVVGGEAYDVFAELEEAS